tara:strand:+ start:278 stop:523 length:246 start_codon:yes stop_codon:yes gene_type:complete
VRLADDVFRLGRLRGSFAEHLGARDLTVIAAGAGVAIITSVPLLAREVALATLGLAGLDARHERAGHHAITGAPAAVAPIA